MVTQTADQRMVLETVLRRQRSRMSPLSHVAGVTLLLAMLSGCTSESTGRTPEVRAVDATSAAELAFHYREEARRLSQLADSLEVEAQALTQSNPDSPDLPRHLSRIQSLRAQVELDFERAREYREQVPHNRVF